MLCTRIVILCLAWAVTIEASALDAEIIKFVTTALDGFLDPATFSMAEVAAGFRVGSLDGGNVTREMLYRKIQGMQAATDMVYIGLANGQFMGYYKESNGSHTYTFLPHENSSCIAEGITSLCRTEFATDDTGAPITQISSRGDFDPRTREWYVLAQTEGAGYTHEPYTFATTGRRGISYAHPLYNSEGQFVGVAGVDFDLASFDALFQELVTDEQRLVFAVDHDLEYLVAASIPGVSTALVNGNWTQVRPEETTSLDIRTSWTELSSIGGDFHELDHVILSDRAALRSFEYYYGEFEIIFVLVREAEPITDHIAIGSFRYSLICSLGVLGLCITLALAITVVKLRHTAVWRMAQPPLLLFMLLANVVGYAFVISNVGDHTRLSCESRNWLLHLGLGTLVLSLHAKLDRVRRLGIASAKLETTNEPASLAIRRVMPFLMIIVVWLTLWSAVEGLRPVRVYTDIEDGQRTFTDRCSDDYALYFFVPAVLYNGSFLVAGCLLAFKMRHLGEDVAESRGMNFIFINFNIIAVIWFGVQYIPGFNVDRASLLAMRSILSIWVQLTSQIAIFGPRIYRYMAHGDFTSQEVAEKFKRGHRRDYHVVCSNCRKVGMDHGSVTIVPTNPHTPTEPVRGFTPNLPVQGGPIAPVRVDGIAPVCVNVSVV